MFLKQFFEKVHFEKSQQTTTNVVKLNSLTLLLLVSPADNLCRQFVPRSGTKNLVTDLDPNCLTLRLLCDYNVVVCDF